jgi:hypothetical protein
MIKISIATDFSRFPGPRKTFQGKHSGESFLNEILRPKYLEAVKTNQKLVVDLDNTEGYLSAFLDGSFGELAREFGNEPVLETLELISQDEPFLKDEIRYYMKPKK